MESYKSEFIDFMVESDVLKFGEFTLKSGRKSPFFMNAGAYVTGSQLKRLGEYYAKAIHANYGDDFDVLFGPAYKGIPLAVVTAIAYHELYGKEVRYCSDRKEAKDHGADTWQQFIYITIPQLKNTLVYVFISNTIYSLKMFTQVYMLTQGGPANSTTTLVYLMYQEGFTNNRVGYTSALAVVFFLIVLVISLIQNKVTEGD